MSTEKIKAMSTEKIKVEMPTRKVELSDAVMIPGIMYHQTTKMKQTLLFVPEEPMENPSLKWSGSGRCYNLQDGTSEFIRKVRKRTEPERLIKTEHGGLIRRNDGNIEMRITVADDGINKIGAILKNESAKIIEIYN